MNLADIQIYLNKDRKASEVLLEKVTKLGAAAVIFTVDTAWKSKRTRDVRAKTTVQVCSAQLSFPIFLSTLQIISSHHRLPLSQKIIEESKSN